MARGNVTAIVHSLPGWKSWHLDLLALLDLQPDRLHASAPLEWLGREGEPGQGSWLGSEFVHLEMGSRSARLHRIEALDSSTAAALVSLLAGHLQGSGVTARVSAVSPTRFFLHSDRTLEAICKEPDFEMDVDIQQLLPQGKNGAELRRLLTEVQMLLHDHPVNAQRERSGLRTVNAIWLSGLGDFESLQPLALPRVWSDEPFVRGLCRLHEARCLPLPRTALELLSSVESGVAVVPVNETADPAADLHALEKDWFAPLAAAVSARQLSGVELHLDRWRISIDRPALRRFWQRGRPLSGLLQ